MFFMVENGVVGDFIFGGDDLLLLLVVVFLFVVFKQYVVIEVDFQNKSVYGVFMMVIFFIELDFEEIQLDVCQCDIDIDNIIVNGFKIKVLYLDFYDFMQVFCEY